MTRTLIALAFLLAACTFQVKLTPEQYAEYMERVGLPTVTPNTIAPPLPAVGPRVNPFGGD